MRKLLIVLALGISLSGCFGPSAGDIMKEAVGNAKTDIPYSKEFIDLFPKAVGWFSHFTGEMGPTTWNLEVGLHNRYILAMQIKVDFNKARTKVIKFNDPEFFLEEVVSVLGSNIRNNPDSHVNFGKDKWKKLVESKGDFSALGIKLTKDKPVDGFEKALTEID